jgi:hypothetical protein
MARPKAVIDAALAEKAEAALKTLPDAKVCIRLKAIISCARYPISLVSAVFGTDRTTLWRWSKRFADKGLAGLADEAKETQAPPSWVQNSGNRWPVGWQKAALAKENPSFGPYRNSCWPSRRSSAFPWGKPPRGSWCTNWAFGRRCRGPDTPRRTSKPRNLLKKTPEEVRDFLSSPNSTTVSQSNFIGCSPDGNRDTETGCLTK